MSEPTPAINSLNGQELYEFLQIYLKEHKARSVIEIGSDIQLLLALRIANSCENVYSVNFQQDHRLSMGWYKMHQNMGGVSNLHLLSGDACQLAELVRNAQVPCVDAVIIKDVLLDANQGRDTTQLVAYNRGELPLSERQVGQLKHRFGDARRAVYQQCFEVAPTGLIISIERPETSEKFERFLDFDMGVEKDRIRKLKLTEKIGEDMSEFPLVAYIIEASLKK